LAAGEGERNDCERGASNRGPLHHGKERAGGVEMEKGRGM
jgi:hypothetical protein